MAYQSIGLGSSANDGNGDTLRGAGTKINANTSEIYGRFGSGTDVGATLATATSANILVGNGTKFASVATSGDIGISAAGAINLSGNVLSIAVGSTPGSTDNKLYNVGNTLFWHGTAIGVAGGGSMTSFTVTGTESDTDQTITNSETLTIAGGTGVETSAGATNTLTVNIDSTVATLTGAQALTNKTIASFLQGSGNTITVPATTDTLVGKATTDTFTNKTIDADGTGNNITNIENANIKAAAAIAVNKLAAATASRALVSDGSGFISASAATATEVGYLSGVSSAIQTQINAKQATISASARIDAAHVHDGTISNTEYGYLNGVTSNIQTQLDAASAIVSYAITVADNGGGSQNVYVIEGTAIKTDANIRKVLHLQKGITYKFDQSHSTNSGHPLRFSITPEGSHNSGSTYTDGVTTAGTPGSSGAYTQIAVKEDAPDILYIYCTSHANMGGGYDGQDAPIYTSDVSGWRIQTADRTASTGDRLFINSSGNARTITLPASAALGDEIEIINLVGTDTHVVNRNGLNINAGTLNGTIDVAQEGLRLVYSNATIGWVATLIESGINTA